jgi:hypothetical protein
MGVPLVEELADQGPRTEGEVGKCRELRVQREPYN